MVKDDGKRYVKPSLNRQAELRAMGDKNLGYKKRAMAKKMLGKTTLEHGFDLMREGKI